MNLQPGDVIRHRKTAQSTTLYRILDVKPDGHLQVRHIQTDQRRTITRPEQFRRVPLTSPAEPSSRAAQRRNQPIKSHPCPHCEETFRTAGALSSHKRACAKRPDEEQLRDDVAGPRSLKDIAHGYGVSVHMLSKWCDLYDIDTANRHVDNGIHVRPDMAPLFNFTYQQHTVCDNCPALQLCQITVSDPGWVLCEAPDEEQLEGWTATGVDVRPIIAIAEDLLADFVGAGSPRPSISTGAADEK